MAQEARQLPLVEDDEKAQSSVGGVVGAREVGPLFPEWVKLLFISLVGVLIAVLIALKATPTPGLFN